MLVINSEGFTLWDEHFDRLKDVVKGWNGVTSPPPPVPSQPAQPTPDDANITRVSSNGTAHGYRDSTGEESSQVPLEEPVSGPFATLITLLRAQHTSFSDFGVLVPFGRLAREGRLFLTTTGDLLSAFLSEDSDASSSSSDRREVENERFIEELGKLSKVDLRTEDINLHKPDSETEWKKRIVGEVGDVVLH